MKNLQLKNILQTWLYMVALGHILVGLALPFVAYSSYFDAYAALLRETFWGALPVSDESLAFQRWIIALFGPTVMSWGVLMTYLIHTGSRSNNARPWNALLIAIAVWAPADIAISSLHHFWLHVVVDIVSVIAMAVPAIILRSEKQFSQ